MARAVYPGLTAATRPQAVVLVDERNWPAALAASALAGAPLGAPLLYADGDEPAGESSEQALQAMHPVGAAALGGAQVIRIGTRAPQLPAGYRARDRHGADADSAAAAAAVESSLSAAAARDPQQVIVAGRRRAARAADARGGLAAESGAPILFVTAARRARGDRRGARQAWADPTIYVRRLDGDRPAHALAELRASARSRASPAPPARIRRRRTRADNAIAVARFTDGTFGWGVHEPGHGLVFANASRPLDAPAAARCRRPATTAPLLLLERRTAVRAALAHYLSDIRAGYTRRGSSRCAGSTITAG